jgi:hypothetical protein
MKYLLGLLLVVSLLGCPKQGPLERAGEKLDEGLDKIAAGGETVGDKVDDAIDDARKEVEDAAK